MNIYTSLHDFLHSLYYRHRDLVPITDFNEYLERTEVREAIHLYMERLSVLHSRQWEPVNMGKRWSFEEDEKLVYACEMGTSINSLAAIHKRTEVAIVKRLNMLGKGYWHS